MWSHLADVDCRQSHRNAREGDHDAESDEQERNKTESSTNHFRGDEGLRKDQRVHIVAFEFSKFLGV